MTHREPLGTVTIPKGGTLAVEQYLLAMDKTPRPKDCMPVLSTAAKMYSRITWHSITVEYEPHASMTTSGQVAVGYSPPHVATLTTYMQVSSMPVNKSTAVCRPLFLKVTTRDIMNKRAYSIDFTNHLNDEDSPGSIYVAVTGDKKAEDAVAGAMYITYSVRLEGLRYPE
jgi:hypothetical protein